MMKPTVKAKNTPTMSGAAKGTSWAPGNENIDMMVDLGG
jgi:hypothetical protein